MESVFRQALALHQAGRLDEAEPLYRQAAGWRPAWALGNLGVLLRTTGRLDEAEAVLREALGGDPGNVAVRHTLGMTLLQAGKYAEGWLHYEARFEIRPPIGPPTVPRWRGEPLTGRRILVVAEQGLGDQILLSRFIHVLAAQAAEVQIAAPRALVRLFAELPARAFHPDGWDEIDADAWTPMGSVPRWLGAGPADAPPPPLYRPPPRTVVSGVGLMLAGAATNGNPNRLPPPPVANAIRGLAAFTDLDPEASKARDLRETAERIAGLERVVTVDTSVAHLAGSMGKPTLILMPRPAIDWYANWKDDRTPWYPSVRLLRQHAPGDWKGVVSDLAAALAAPPPRDLPQR